MEKNWADLMSVSGMILRLGQTLDPVVMGGVFVLGGMEWVFSEERLSLSPC
jgi:hypothetical protein